MLRLFNVNFMTLKFMVEVMALTISLLLNQDLFKRVFYLGR